MLDSGLQDQGADGLPRHLRQDTRGVDGASSGYGQGSSGVRAPSPWDPAFAGKTEVVGCGLAIGRRLIFITSCGIRKAIVIPSPSCLSF